MVISNDKGSHIALNEKQKGTGKCRNSRKEKTLQFCLILNLVPTVVKLHLFKAAILPYLTYCHLTWHFCRASDKRKLGRTQERGLRAVFRDCKSTYEELLKKANLKSLYERRLQDIACLMFKVKHLFSLKSSTYNLRGADFHIPRFNTVTYGKHSLRYIGSYAVESTLNSLKKLTVSTIF